MDGTKVRRIATQHLTLVPGDRTMATTLEVGLMETREELGLGTVDIFPFPTEEDFLWRLIRDLFTNHWSLFRFGQHIQGGVAEITLFEKPSKVALFDGYVTVEVGPWFHMHVCIGWSVGKGCEPTAPDVSELRRPSCAHLYRKRSRQTNCPMVWGMRIYNGAGEQTFHIFFPNPLLQDEMQPLTVPDWPKLWLWNYIRLQYLGLDPDSEDRTATHFVHD